VGGDQGKGFCDSFKGRLLIMAIRSFPSNEAGTVAKLIKEEMLLF
jgi:hypothetical protein